MTQLIAVDADALSEVITRLARLESKLADVTVQTVPEWMTIKQYAAHIERSTKTVKRRIDAGTIACRTIQGERMIKVNPAA